MSTLALAIYPLLPLHHLPTHHTPSSPSAYMTSVNNCSRSFGASTFGDEVTAISRLNRCDLHIFFTPNWTRQKHLQPLWTESTIEYFFQMLCERRGTCCILPFHAFLSFCRKFNSPPFPPQARDSFQSLAQVAFLQMWVLTVSPGRIIRNNINDTPLLNLWPSLLWLESYWEATTEEVKITLQISKDSLKPFEGLAPV